MKNKTRFYATLILFLVSAAATLGALYLGADFPAIWKALAGVTGGILVLHIGTNAGVYRDIFSRRTTKYGLKSVLQAAIVLAIVIFVNLIVKNYDWKKDVTKNKVHTLSEQSIKVLQGLQKEVVLKAFVNPTQVQEFNYIFDKYTYYSKNLKREYIDVDKDPQMVQQYGIKTPGTLVVESGDRTSKVENIAGPDDPKLEEKITNAIISVVKGGKKRLYYVTGHGERALSGTDQNGFSGMKDALENSRYQVEELVLLGKDAIPSDAELVIVAGPKSEFLAPEYKALDTYIRGGGKAMILVEPTSPPSLKNFLAGFSANWTPKKMIVETNGLDRLAGGSPLTPVVTTYDKGHEITRDAKELSIFPVCSPVEKAANAPGDFTVTSLFSTSNRSFLVDPKNGKVQVDPAKDPKGPFSLGLAISGKVGAAPPPQDPTKPGEPEIKQKEFRLIVVGDSDFASNSARQFGMNSDLFQNMTAWLAQEEDLIAIRPRATNESEFEITEQRARVINLASIVVAPIAMFLAGFVVFLIRRRR